MTHRNTQEQATTECTRPEAHSHDSAPAEAFGEPITDLHQNLWSLFSVTALAYPEREAIVSRWQPAEANQSTQDHDLRAPSGCLRWSYQNLRDKTEHVADALGKLGLGPGMHVAVMLWNCAEWGLLLWATAKIGAVFVPIDPKGKDDIPYVLRLTKPRVIIVQDGEAALALTRQDKILEGSLIRIHCSKDSIAGWMSLYDLLLPSLPVRLGDAFQGGLIPDSTVKRSSPALIVFTSGTTGQPKGCPHTDRNLVSQTHEYDRNTDVALIDRWLVHTPVCHIFAINNALRAWRHGGTVVFASKSFDVGSTLEALVQEQCTVMSATPTLVKALLAHPAFPSPQDLNLSIVSIAGTMIKAEDIRLCREGLGARDAIQAYGLSEGAPLISWSRRDGILVDGYHSGVGKTLPGTLLRICSPDTQEILARGQVGELHVGGSSVIHSYLDSVDEGRFYEDTSGRWLKTGDQGMIDEQGVVHILGRYKDLIIRGGENINPLKIELALAEIPSLQAHIVGIPDHIAGQVPVAIVKLPAGVSKPQVAQKASLLGPQYALDAVYTLEDLGLESIPVTSIGKPKKAVLADAVMKLRLANMNKKNANRRQLAEIEGALLGIWEQLTGTRPAKDDNVLYLADSITLLRYCDGVLRTCGRQLYLQDFNDCDTVEKQAKLLLSGEKQQQPEPSHGSQHSSCLTSHSHPNRFRVDSNHHHHHHHHHHPQALAYGISAPNGDTNTDDAWASAHEQIDRLGFEGSKIENVIPIRSSLHRMVVGQRPQSYHIRVVFRLHDVTPQQIHQGLVKCISVWPMMRAILVQTARGHLYHAVVETIDCLIQKLIQDVEVDTDEEARSFYEDSSTSSHTSAFMFNAAVIKIKQTGSYILSMTYNHSVVDALTLLPWHRDLDRLIHNAESTIPSPTPYWLFADLFSQYQDSLPAQKAVSFHVKRLRGISRYTTALWPRQRAPGTNIASDEGSPYAQERQIARDRIWKGEWEAAKASEFRFPRRSRVVSLPSLVKLRDKHSVEPVLFTKCALAIFNILQTNSSVALFNTWESARSWPFVPRWIEESLPPAMSIGGPTVEWILNMIEVHHNETLVDFFDRMTHQQDQMRQYEHVPWEKVVQQLREEGDVAVDASFRQSFVWDVSMGIAASRGFRSDFSHLEPISRLDWPDCALFWNAFTIDKENLFFVASWDTAQMNVDEVDQHCNTLAAVMRKLANEENWHQLVGDVFSNEKTEI